jgi:YD repeat-containing protein
VNVANGNMFRDEVDFVMQNIGVPLTFARHYDAQSQLNIGLGVGWTHSFSDVLYRETASSNDLTWLDSSGVRHTFKWSANAFTVPADLKGRVTLLGSSANPPSNGMDWTEFQFKDSDGIEHRFQKVAAGAIAGSTLQWVGRLKEVVDREGHGVKVTVNPQRQITKLEDIHAATRNLQFTIDPTFVEIAINDPANLPAGSQPTRWKYDLASTIVAGSTVFQLRKATGNTTAAAAEQAITTYGYYGDDKPWRGLMQLITEPDLSWHQYEYFFNGRVFRVKQGDASQTPSSTSVATQVFNYNLIRNTTEFANERGTLETYAHQNNGLLKKQIHADRSQLQYEWGTGTEEFLMKKAVDERGAAETFRYYTGSDFKAKQLWESTAKSIGSTGLLTRYEYVQPDSVNRPHLVGLWKTIVDPSSSQTDPGTGYYVEQTLTTELQYNSAGRLWKTIDALGNVTEYAYYGSADPVHLRGLVRSQFSPAVLVNGSPVIYETIHTYDQAGNVISSQTAGLPTTTYAYHTSGQVKQAKDGANVTVETIYDGLGRAKETGFGNTDAAIDPIDAFASRFVYDAMGRITQSIDPLGRTTAYQYNRLGQVIVKTNPDGSKLFHEYDALGNCIRVIDELGRSTRFFYDSRNRLVQTIYADRESTRVRFDGAGNVVASFDELGNVTTSSYDAAGRVVETKRPDPLTGKKTSARPWTT